MMGLGRLKMMGVVMRVGTSFRVVVRVRGERERGLMVDVAVASMEVQLAVLDDIVVVRVEMEES